MKEEIIKREVVSEKAVNKKNIHHEKDETELRRLESRFESNSDGNGSETVEITEIETEEIQPEEAKSQPWRKALVLSLVAVVALAAIVFWWSRRDNTKTDVAVTTATEKKDAEETGAEVKLEPEALNSAKIQIEGVTQRPAVATLNVTGSVELNSERTEMATPLVGGRVESVNYGLGDYVQKGAVLATLSSPQLAEMRGKMHEAEARLNLAQQNLARVQKSENRASIVQAKARLDEAAATLKRTKRLIELGAGKDIIAAETAYTTAKSDYDFQSNIQLNKEIQEARAEVQTGQIDLTHIRNQLVAFGAGLKEGETGMGGQNTSLIPVRAPLSGVVTERRVNTGAGVTEGTPMFAISNLSSVYVIANVPEANIGSVRQGSLARIKSPSLGANSLLGRISYIDPRLNEDTRTARTRIEVDNPGERLRAGMFVEVGFQTSSSAAGGEELVIPTAAVQRDGDRTFVFIPKGNEPGAFEVRTIEIGGEIEGYARVISGLKLGEQVVSEGSFTLKTQLKKGEMSEE
ncbi:MAG: efflux RND transporter periplasmic adaptor subunit [Pyrinomonadaceae bacterium]